MSTTTSNMSLVKPSVGDTDYPTSVSDSFELVDDHDHSTGKGVQIPAGGLASNSVTTAKILDANVTKAKLAALGQQISASCGTFTTTSAVAVDVTNLTVTITTIGRPVFIGLIPDGSGGFSSALTANITGGVQFRVGGIFYILEDGATIGTAGFLESFVTSNSGFSINYPVGSVFMIYPAAAGTHTYKIQASRDGFADAAATIGVTNAKLVVYEL